MLARVERGTIGGEGGGGGADDDLCVARYCTRPPLVLSTSYPPRAFMTYFLEATTRMRNVTTGIADQEVLNSILSGEFVKVGSDVDFIMHGKCLDYHHKTVSEGEESPISSHD